MNTTPNTHGQPSSPLSLRERAGVRARPAFTLMEMLIAIFILSIGLIGIASIFPVALLQQKYAVDDTQATIFGRNVIAQLQQQGVGGLAVTGDGDFHAGPRPTLSNPLYDYLIAYRRKATSDPAEVAVFVMRKDDNYNAWSAIKEVESVSVTTGGTGYVAAPAVVFTGGGYTTSATATAVSNGSAVTSVTVTSPGVGYTTTPLVAFTGGGSGATGVAHMRGIISLITDNSMTVNTTDGTVIIPSIAELGRNRQYLLVWQTGSPANVVRVISTNKITPALTDGITCKAMSLPSQFSGGGTTGYLPLSAVAIVTGRVD